MDPNTHCNLFPIRHLCILTLVTWQLQVVYECCTYRMTTILSEMSIFCVRAECMIWLASYGYKHSWQFLSNKPFVCPHMHNLKTTGYTLYILMFSISRTALLSETFLAWLQKRFNWRATAPGTHQSLSDSKLYAYTASPYMYIHVHRYLACNYDWQQNSCTLWLHATHQMMALQPTLHRFIRARLASYTTCCRVFQINRLC